MGTLAARYGVIATITYLVLSQTVFWLIYFGLRFSGLDSGTIIGAMPESWTRGLGIKTGREGVEFLPAENEDGTPLVDPSTKVPGWLTEYVDPTVFGITFIVSKVLVPLKLGMVVWLTPRVARVWWRLGVVGPPAGVDLRKSGAVVGAAVGPSVGNGGTVEGKNK